MAKTIRDILNSEELDENFRLNFFNLINEKINNNKFLKNGIEAMYDNKSINEIKDFDLDTKKEMINLINELKKYVENSPEYSKAIEEAKDKRNFFYKLFIKPFHYKNIFLYLYIELIYISFDVKLEQGANEFISTIVFFTILFIILSTLFFSFKRQSTIYDKLIYLLEDQSYNWEISLEDTIKEIEKEREKRLKEEEKKAKEEAKKEYEKSPEYILSEIERLNEEIARHKMANSIYKQSKILELQAKVNTLNSKLLAMRK